MNLKSIRFYAFDFIRAFAALWGVAFHAGMAYMNGDSTPWLLSDPSIGSPIVDILTWLSYRIRMPLFFLMSGFFSCLVIKKKGIYYYLKNKTKKLLVPLFVAGLILLPIIVELFSQPIIQNNDSSNILSFLNTSFNNPYVMNNFKQMKLAHLWFLAYLFLCSLAAVILNKYNFFNKIKLFFYEYRLFGKITILLSLFLINFSMDNYVRVDRTYDFNLSIKALIYYFYFFSWGFILFEKKKLESLKVLNLKKTTSIAIISGVISILLIKLCQINQVDRFQSIFEFIISLSTLFYTLFSLTTIIALSLRLIKKSNYVITYLCDSSYWIYIIHIPIVILFQRTLFYWDAHSLVKWIIVSILSYIFSFLSYQYFVRYSWIGTFLHGKRTHSRYKIDLNSTSGARFS